MKMILGLVKTALLGGLFVLLPLLLLYLLLAQAVDLIIMLATPLADLFPEGTFGEIRYPGLLALLLVIAFSLVIGLAMRSAIARSIGRAIERSVLDRLPLYGALTKLTRGFVQTGDGDGFKAAALVSPDGVRELVYIVEDAGEWVTVLRPHAPTGFAGRVGVVPRDQVELLDGTVGDASRVLAHWGVGMQSLLERKRETE